MSAAASKAPSKNIFPESERNRRVSSKAIHKVRLRNLQAIIKERFKGNAAQCAKAIERSHTFLWQLMNKRRAIGEDTARHIEESLGLEERALDQDNVLKPTTLMVAQLGNGTTIHFQLVPMVELSAGLKTKTGEYRPCPTTGCSEKTVFAKVTNEAMEPILHKGELVFIDKRDTQLRDGSVYAIEVKNAPVPMFKMARERDGGRGFAFVSARGNGETISDRDIMQILGRVIHAMRDIA